ncbi:hypothetical protein [Micromonospora psammae]|uniref:hypothetical protein n=1 Tax=Micromonospora sp. CPCC 205556 TaxID=3122398 RepID=UPI002FF29580
MAPTTDPSARRRAPRRWLGRLDSSSVVAWAGLAALVCGLFGAALATRLAWETARPMPGRAEAGEVFRSVLPGHRLDDVSASSAFFVFYTHPVRLHHLDQLLLGDGGEYEQATTQAWTAGTPPVPVAQAVTEAQRRLREAGWHLDGISVTTDNSCADKFCAASASITRTTVEAHRRDTLLTLTTTDPTLEADVPYASIGLRRATPPLVPYAAVAGGLAGALAGWLVFGWASRRTEGTHPAGSVVKGLFGVTMVLWWTPVLLGAPSMATHHSDEPHTQWHPLWEWLGQPALSLPFLLGTVSALAACGLAATPRRAAAHPAG